MATSTSSKLPTLVREAFKAAQRTGDLTFYQTQVSILQCNGHPFQIRFSPALANKPKTNKRDDSKEKFVDPFSDPSKGLLITDLPFHNLVLNKFPIIPDHFILATKDFKEQTDILEEDDLCAAYQCLKAYRENGEELFGFFNCGDHSGASQPHRHIQFAPVESMRSGMPAGKSWEILADSLIKTPAPDLPMAYFSQALPDDSSSKVLHETYTALYTKACRVVLGSAANPSSANIHPSISYNMGLTDRVMVLCPRRAEGMELKDSRGESIGSVSLNGTILGGTLLVKNEAEYSALRNDQSKLIDILQAIGFSPTRSEFDEKL